MQKSRAGEVEQPSFAEPDVHYPHAFRPRRNVPEGIIYPNFTARRAVHPRARPICILGHRVCNNSTLCDEIIHANHRLLGSLVCMVQISGSAGISLPKMPREYCSSRVLAADDASSLLHVLLVCRVATITTGFAP